MIALHRQSQPYPRTGSALASIDPLPGHLLRLPSVYPPREDTWLLAEVMNVVGLTAESTVLDLCTGTGALAVAAARSGALRVTAVDVSRLAVASAWLNARVRRLPISARRANVLTLAPTGTFNVILANPPYVPCEVHRARGGRYSSRWDAGPDGRALLDPLCELIPTLLTPGGIVLLVQSAVCGVAPSTLMLQRRGLETSVVARRRIGFGPVMWSRVEFLERSGLIEAGQRHEDLVVIRGRRPAHAN